PLRMGYGCITAAGCIIRKNELKNDRIILGGGFKEASLPRREGVYSQVDMIVNNNIAYIAGLISLSAWYHNVRPLFVHDYFSGELLLGMQKNLADCIDERIKRLKNFSEKLIISKKILLDRTKDKKTASICLHDTALEMLKKAEDIFNKERSLDQMSRSGESFVKAIELGIKDKGQLYIPIIQGLDPQVAREGSRWLYGIEEKIITALGICARKGKPRV
ncbi:MAG: protein GlmU, partial [Desulfobacula sp.]|nr:protein GlmU [Desulfobacula sp.]